MNLKAWSAVLGVFIGCCSNVIFLELLVRYDSGSGNLITFSQFLFIAIEGYVFTSKFGTVKPVVGFKDYAILVLMFFVTNVCNNYAFDFNIPMPLHMIFRAGSLMANMVMGILILKKHYGLSKYLSVVLITVGIITCTMVSASKVEDTSNPKHRKEDTSAGATGYSVVFWWCVGIGILTVALLISACMGIYQEVLYKKYGKCSREALYYTHLFPLPGFLLMGKNIWEHFLISTASEPLAVMGVNTFLPEQIVYIICNMITQYVCISSVYVLTAECSSLTVTLVVTLRKFVSLLFSIVYFKNSFTIYHWIGTLLVFTGTIIFTESYPKLLFKSTEAKKEQLQRHNLELEEFQKYAHKNSLGKPYLWLQKMIGNSSFNNTKCNEMQTQKLKDFTLECVKRIRNYLHTRLNVISQIRSFMNKNIEQYIKDKANNNMKPNCTLVQWSAVTWEEYESSRTTAPFIDSKLASDYGSFFRAVMVLSSAKMECLISICNKFPMNTPLWTITVHWNGHHNALNNSSIKVMEHYTNTLKDYKQESNLLAYQLLRTMYSFDIFLETEGPLYQPLEYNKEKSFIKSFSKRLRMRPFKRIKNYFKQ